LVYIVAVDDPTYPLSGRHALVVGGSGGIGASVATDLARAGAEVTVHGGHDRERLDRSRKAVRGAGTLRDATLHPIEHADDGASLLERTGLPDILVCAFGPYLEQSFLDTPDDQFRRMVELNLHLPAVMIREVLPAMLERAWGRIVVFGGPRSDRIVGFRKIAAYAASKAGLASLVRSVALQCAGTGVSCNMIAPGYVETEYYPAEAIEALRKRIPGGRLIRPQEVARVTVELVAGSSAAVNGAIIPVDFGI
jgi:3-oxoacyl-[acyl-carrier protein] reductase